VTPPSNSLISGYVVLIDNGFGGPYQVAYDGSLNPSLLNITITGLSSQMTYSIVGYAKNIAGSGTNSTAITCYTATIPG
jgi:hypothetical protein